MDISQIPEIIEASLYPYILSEFQSARTEYQNIANVLPYDPMKAYGEKGSAATGLGEPTEFEDGEELDMDSEDTAKTWQMKIRQYGRRIFIPDRLANQMGAVGLGNYVQEKAAGWGSKTALVRDKFVAGMFQKGTLSAGSAAYFDNSYPGQADPQPLFAYDGQPWFDTAHPLSASASTLSNHTVSLALSRDNLQTVITAFESTLAKDERGDDIDNIASTLLVPPGLEFTAREILGSALSGADNELNAVQGRLRLVPWRRLTDDADAWWVLRDGAGLRVRDSGAPELFVERAADGKRGFYVGTVSYFGATVTDIRGAYCANKAAS